MKKIFTLIAVLACALGVQAAAPTWTIAGEVKLMGVAWDPAAEENLMSRVGDDMVLAKENVMLKAGEYEYKACEAGGWDVTVPQEGNYKLVIDEDGAYTVTFTLKDVDDAENRVLSATATKTGEYEGSTEAVWVVAGVEELLGVFWKGDLAEGGINKMTSTDDKIYTLKKTDVALNKDTPYEYKFVQDESAWYGDGGEGVLSKEGGNFKLFVDEPGKYSVTFTLNTETMVATIATEKTGEASFDDKVWTIAGAEAVLGSNWEPTDENNDMEDMGDGTFQLVKTNVTLAAGAYTYKVVANHSWSENYGGDYDSDGNAVVEIDADGTYDITFVFIPETKELYATADEATGIKGVKNAAANKNTTMYNLQGQRVQAGFRGIVIMNGRKMIVK